MARSPVVSGLNNVYLLLAILGARD